MFNPAGEPIAPQQWLQFYEQAYFLKGSNIGRRLNRSSPFVEEQACNLLNAIGPLTPTDFKLIMAWKMGVIYHRLSEEGQQVLYWPAWNENLVRYKTSYAASLNWMLQNQDQIRLTAAHNPEAAFNQLVQAHLTGFGTTYILTIFFFLTNGRQPIYDRYAHAAAQAIATNTVPGQRVHFRRVASWQQYLDYQALLAPVVQTCGLALPVPRSVDRALWAYGHLFS
jgi:hypothetical protein